MEAFDSKTPPEQCVRHSGTWNANPLAAVAGIATLKILRTGEPQKRSDEAAAWLREGLNRAFMERNINGYFYGNSICHGYFGSIDYDSPSNTMPPIKTPHKVIDPVRAPIWRRILLHLLQQGVDNMGGRQFILSTVHTEEDLAKTVKAFGDALDAIITDGTLRIE